MGPAQVVVNTVGKGEDRFALTVRVGQGNFRPYVLISAFEVDALFVNLLLLFGQLFDELLDTALKQELLFLHFLGTMVFEIDLQTFV